MECPRCGIRPIEKGAFITINSADEYSNGDANLERGWHCLNCNWNENGYDWYGNLKS